MSSCIPAFVRAAHGRDRRCGLAALLAMLLLAVSASALASESPLTDARQLIVVSTADWNATTGTLRRYSRDGDGDGWRQSGVDFPVTIGRSGSAWGLGLHDAQEGPQKREGDGKAPAGAFAIGTAFGYAEAGRTGWPYQAMTASDWCIDVPDSPLYNKIVDANEVGEDAVRGSTEPMRRDIHADGDRRYAVGFVIAHNPANVPGGGSCIFAHVWKAPGETTAGCTAMDEKWLRHALAWLKPDAKPVFVLLPKKEAKRLRRAWGLP